MSSGVSIPQTPGGNKVPSLDMSKVTGVMQHEPPQSTTNKGSGRLLLQSPANIARNALNDRAKQGFGDGKDKQDGVNKREIPNSEYQDFLQTYDDTMW